jgi:hypothetical protein
MSIRPAPEPGDVRDGQVRGGDARDAHAVDGRASSRGASADGHELGEDEQTAGEEQEDEAHPMPAPRRWPILVLAVGAMLVASVFQRVAPRERTVVLRLSSPTEVQRIDATWLAEDGEVLGASRFEPRPDLPLRLESKLRLRNGGSLGVSLVVERTEGGVERLEQRVTVADEGDVIVMVPSR